MNQTFLFSSPDSENKKTQTEKINVNERSYVNPFSEELHRSVPDFKSLGIFLTEPIAPERIYLWTPYKGKQIDVIDELKYLFHNLA